MLKTPPPKHRHDGSSPLPLGMDWSPPPRKWNGRLTVWPHDHHTGWSYCVTIPSWVVLPKSRNSDPVVFYRVQVGIQSPEGITTTRGILRRFNDFLKLSADVKKTCPKKNLPPAPPKGLLRMRSRALLEERRCSLEEWMTKLLSDIDVSRNIAVASFLELEAAARSSFQDENQQSSESSSAGSSINSSVQLHPHSSLSVVAGSSSVTSDCGSDTAYETSEHGTPRLTRDNSSEFGLEDLTMDEDLANPMEKLVKFGISNIDEGLFMGHTILDQLEGLPRHKVHGNTERKEMGNGNGNASKASFLVDNQMDLFSEQDKVTGHARRLSNESIGSDVSSQRGSQISNSGVPGSFANGSHHFRRGSEVSSTTPILSNREQLLSGDTQLILPLDQRHKMNSVLMSMQRRLVTAKTDMEDLIARLNQEIAVKDYLTTKVKDLEVELENTRQKNKENLQQAILVERERFTQMQWDMEELRRKSLEMELKLKSEQKSHIVSTREASAQDKDEMQTELNAAKEQLENLLKRYEELEAKSKADIKVLVKEVKSLRSSQTKLKQELTDSLKEKSVAEEVLQQEKQMSGNAKACRQKLLYECRTLLTRLRECDVNLSIEDENKFAMDSSSITEAFDLLTRYDNQIGLLLGEAKFFTQDNDIGSSKAKDDDRACNIDNSMTAHDDRTCNMDDELRKLVADMFMENARLRKQVNSATRHALRNIIPKKDDISIPPGENS